MTDFDPLQTLGTAAKLPQMGPWRRFADSIKREVAAEGIGWLVGGLVRRQLLALVALLPAFVAIVLPREAPVRNYALWASFGVWVIWNLLTVAVGIFYIGRWADKQ